MNRIELDDHGARPSSRMNVLRIVVVLFAISFGLRATGVDFLLPCSPEPDDIYALQADFLRTNTANPEYASYPLMVGELVRDFPEGAAESDDLASELARAKEQLLRPRWICAFASAAIAPATWWLARGFLGEWWAIVAGLFAATSLLHVDFSQQARPHAPLAAAVALALAAALRARATGRWRDWIFTSAMWFFALGFLQSAIFVVPTLAVANVAREGERKTSDALRWLAPFAALALAVFVFYPYLVDFGQWARVQDEKVQIGAHNFVWNKFNGSGFERLFGGLWHFDPALCAAAIVGAAVGCVELAARRKTMSRAPLAVVASFAIPYALVFGFYGGSFDRFVMPLIPVIALLAAFGVRAIARALAKPFAARARAAPIVAIAIAVLALALPSWAAIRLVELRAQADTLDLVARWIEQKLDPATTRLFVNYGAELPLPYSQSALDADLSVSGNSLRYFWTRQQALRKSPMPNGWDVRSLAKPGESFWTEMQSDPRAALASLGVCRVVCVRFAEDVHGGTVKLLHDSLERFGRREIAMRAIFDPSVPTGSFAYESNRFLADLLLAKCVGPSIEVYELDPDRPIEPARK